MADLRYRALLVGNAEFEGLPKLKGPPNDVRSLSAALTDPTVGLHSASDVQVLLDAHHHTIAREIEGFFGSGTQRDQLLFYYSGHGLQDIRDRLYLCARDTDRERLISTGVSSDAIKAMMELCAAQIVVVVLDCCYSGNFKSAAVGQCLSGEGRFILTSCRAGDLAEDSPEIHGHSAFTKLLVDALVSGGVDANSDGLVSVNELYDHVLPQLKAKGQLPQRYFDRAIGDAFLGRSTQVGRRPVSPPHPPEASKTPALSPAPEAPARPRLEVSETSIEIKNLKPGEVPRDEIIDVFNTGGGTLDWTAECEDDWVQIEPHRGFIKIRMRPRPGANRAAIRVRDRGGGGSKTVRVFAEVLAAPERPHPSPDQPAPARPHPAPPAPSAWGPPPTPAPVASPPRFVDIAGDWAGAGGGLFRFVGTGPVYEMHDMNALGALVGQGQARVEGDVVSIQAFNQFQGPWAVQLTVQGEVMTGRIFVQGQIIMMALQRIRR